MAEYIESLQNLAEQFGKLGGVGRKSALRMAFSVLDMTDEEAAEFARAIVDAKERIHLCPICQNLTDRELCYVCNDETRDHSVICVVSDPKTVISMEKVREYRGTYHVLHGLSLSAWAVAGITGNNLSEIILSNTNNNYTVIILTAMALYAVAGVIYFTMVKAKRA